MVTVLEEPLPKVKKRKVQSRLASFLESLSNESVGYTINTIIQVAVFPFFGIFLSLSANMLTSGIHSFFGLSRIYILRRIFSGFGKKQTSKGSALECVTNIVASVFINFLVTMFVYPFVGVHIPISSNIGITMVFLLVTLMRMYILRSWFNMIMVRRRKAKKALKKAMKARSRALLIEQMEYINGNG